VGPGPASEISFVNDGTPRAAWIANPGANGDGTLYYAECTANCGSQNPTFSSFPFDAGEFAHVSLEPLPGGGIAGALMIRRSAVRVDVLYAECTSGCTSPSSWATGTVETDTDTAKPDLAVSGATRAIAYGNMTGVWYGECALGCTGTMNNWFGVPIAPGPADSALALTFSSGGVERVLATENGTVLTCSSNCSLPFWNTATLSGVAPNHSLVFAGPEPRLLGESVTSMTYFVRAGIGWSQNLAPGLPLDNNSFLDLDVDDAGVSHLAYSSPTDTLRVSRAEADGGFTTTDVHACGTAVMGSNPSQVLIGGRRQLVYSTPTEVRFTMP
jgi:hypothetical protein